MKKLTISLFALMTCLFAGTTVSAQEDCTVSVEVDWNCFGENSGWAVVESVSGAVNPTTILWSTGETVQFVSGLTNGEHWVMVTDANGCWDKEYFTIACPVGCEIDFTVDHACEGEGQGWATVGDITGAMGTTSVLWSTGETTNTINGLSTGEYWVMVTDEENCWHKEYIYVACPSDDCAIEFTLDHDCEVEGDGWATVSDITGNTMPTSIAWSTGENVPSISGLVSGDYWVTVYESELCWSKQYFTVDCAPEDCEVELMVNWGCNGPGDGWAVVEQVTGAANPTQILWSTGETVQFITGLPSGEHWVMVTDADGCWDKEYFTVSCPEDCELDFDLDYGCTGDEGWAEVSNMTGATGSTAILWSTDEVEADVDGLESGEYWAMVTDEGGCWAKQYFVIECGGVEEEPCQLRTQTMGGWGSPGNGNNPGAYRDAHFDAAFPNGLTIGCDNTLTLTSAEAVEEFLPSGGQSQQLPEGSMTDPGNYNNNLAGQLVALTLSVGFDLNDADFGTGGLLADAVLNNGTFEGWMVQQLLDEANQFIGGCGSTYTAQQLGGALAMVNENFVDGDTNEGNVDCAPEGGERLLMEPGSPVSIRTYPVPAVNTINIDVTSDLGGVIDVKLIDALGRTVLQRNNEAFNANEMRTLNFDINALNNGSYLIRVDQNGTTVKTDRIIVSK